MFQLRRRLQRLGGSQSDGTLLDDDAAEIDEHGICDGKSAGGNRGVRARFGRRRTHNEETCVASCGIILGRATFFGSEAPNGVRVRNHHRINVIVLILSIYQLGILKGSFSNTGIVTWGYLARQQLQGSSNAQLR
jgi:hypothetical protein